MSTPFLGQIEIFSFNFAPKSWAQCNGQLLPINQNQALFSLLGTTFGGDGRVTFGLPDLRSRLPISFGPQNNIGVRAGEEAHTLIGSENGAHTHSLMADTTTNPAPNNTPAPAGSSVFGIANGAITPSGTFNVTLYSPGNFNATLSPTVISNTGGNQPHTNIQPYLTLNFCIALQGIFPSRN
ncbi:MAG: phage tail protein [Alphaproteobacteria bacterium]|nr:MAG: phage tail protein [Alphaproteobacteria bacterium]